MKPINHYLAAIEPLKCNMKAVSLHGLDAIDVSEIARNRYHFKVPVMISQAAYQCCVLSPSRRIDEDASREILWLLKVLALAKYAIRNAGAKKSRVRFIVKSNDHKVSPTEENLIVQVYPGAEDQPMLLIRRADERLNYGLGRLLNDVAGIDAKRFKEAS